MAEEKLVLTPEAKKELERELKALTTTIRKKIVDELEESRKQGDLSENSWHDAVLEKRDQNELRISEIENMLKTAEVVEASNCDDEIKLGCSVEVEIEIDGNKVKKEFEIVPATQADPMNNKISMDSPLGKVLIGKSVDDLFNYKQPNGVEAIYKILKIN